MIAILVILVLTILAAPIALAREARARKRRAKLRAAIFGFFAEAGAGHDLLQVAVDADWVALWIAGLPPDSRISTLAAPDQARVLLLAEDVIAVAEDLIQEGLIARLPVVFQSLGKAQQMRPPRGLFMLTPRGAAAVLTRGASHAAAA